MADSCCDAVTITLLGIKDIFDAVEGFSLGIDGASLNFGGLHYEKCMGLRGSIFVKGTRFRPKIIIYDFVQNPLFYRFYNSRFGLILVRFFPVVKNSRFGLVLVRFFPELAHSRFPGH